MMTSNAHRPPLIGALLTLSLIVFGAPWSPSQVASAQSQQLFLSVTDGSGEPVTDLRTDELIVQWDDVDCETLDLELIHWPVRVTVFVDNGDGGRAALQDMREGLKLFVDAIPAEVEVALATLAGRAQFVTQLTSDREELVRGIDLIVPDSAGARFRDALVEEAGRLIDDDERQYFPVIVMVASDGPEGSSSQQGAYDEMLDRMTAASATVHTLMFTSGSPAQGQQVQIGMNLRNRTSGTYEALAISTGFRSMLPELGQNIARKHHLVSNQYRVTYAPPEGTTSVTAVRVSTSREAVTLTPTMDGNIQ